MKKSHYIIVIVVIILGSLLLFWGSQAGENTISANDIYTLIEQGETQIDLTKLTDLEWTQVDVFGPYTTDEMIEDSMDIQFNFLFGGIDVLETDFLLVFANEKKPVKKIYLSRKYGDYTVKDNKILIVE
ncbi:hypothetical protein [Solibacillus sp. FSL K6-1126]|uniref:hypothetical protein n=1 Tax=Solibacillus sp. FSL K6-1126 TaxID=2921463 RepID=UPI0030F50A8F